MSAFLFEARLIDTGQISVSDSPDLVLMQPCAPVSGGGKRYKCPPDGYVHLGIRRRTYFRWRDYGQTHQDFPPFDQPAELESWYARMKQRGMFKHQFPADMREAIAAHIGAAPDTRPAAESAFVVSEPPSLSPSAPAIVDAEYQGLEHELHQLRSRVASLRQARDAAYAAELRTEGDLQDSRYREAFNDLTIAEKRAIEVLEKRKLLISRAGVEQDLAPRITGVVIGGMYFLDRIEPQLDAITDPTARRARRRALWIEHCAPLLQGKFVPEHMSRLPAEIWLECAAWLQGTVPPPLQLSA